MQSAAAEYPDRPIRIIVPNGAGGSTDLVARVLAPAGTPRAIIYKLNATLIEALQSPAVRIKLEEAGAEAIGGSPAAFGAYIKAELEKWRNVVRATGVKAE